MEMNSWLDFLEIATSVVGTAAIFASFIPQPYSGILLALHKALNMGAFNFGKAQNKDA